MTTQSKERQRARRRATDAATLARVREAKKDQRVSRLATKLAVTMARRDEAIERWDRRLGEVLVALTRGEHLRLEEAIAWSGARLTRREASRLRSLAECSIGAGTEGARTK